MLSSVCIESRGRRCLHHLERQVALWSTRISPESAWSRSTTSRVPRQSALTIGKRLLIRVQHQWRRCGQVGPFSPSSLERTPLEPKSGQCLVYDMSSFLQQVAPTPFLDDNSSSESEERGQLSSVAEKVLMKLLFAARMCRYDLLRAFAR